MNQRRNTFYTFWAAAIALAVALSIFALIFASCSGGSSEADPSPAGGMTAVDAEETEAPAEETQPPAEES